MIDKIKTILAIAIVIAGVAAYYQFGDLLQVARVGIVVGSVVIAALLWLSTPKGKQLWSFMTGARTEVRKVVWPTRREAMQVTAIVLVGAVIMSLYMWILDSISFYFIYDLILGVRSS